MVKVTKDRRLIARQLKRWYGQHWSNSQECSANHLKSHDNTAVQIGEGSFAASINSDFASSFMRDYPNGHRGQSH
jgi:hypothetical protein